LSGGFDGHHIADIAHHAYHRGIAARLFADGACFVITQVVASPAILDMLTQVGQGMCKALHLFRLPAEEIKYQAQSSFATDAWQACHLINCFFYETG
jgi:hypothetical protein